MSDPLPARDAVVPYIGERATDLFSRAVLGGDVGEPELTEAERLLIVWGSSIGGANVSIDDAALENTFSAPLRASLLALAVELKRA